MHGVGVDDRVGVGDGGVTLKQRSLTGLPGQKNQKWSGDQTILYLTSSLKKAKFDSPGILIGQMATLILNGFCPFCLLNISLPKCKLRCRGFF